MVATVVSHIRDAIEGIVCARLLFVLRVSGPAHRCIAGIGVDAHVADIFKVLDTISVADNAVIVPVPVRIKTLGVDRIWI